MSVKQTLRTARRRRIRSRIHGTAVRPRLSIFRSQQAIEVQLIDDTVGKTLLSVRLKHPTVANVAQAGTKFSHDAVAKGIKTIVFDRGGYKYHGIVKALADSARQGGLQF